MADCFVVFIQFLDAFFLSVFLHHFEVFSADSSFLSASRTFSGLFLMQIGTYLTSTRKKDGWLQRGLVYCVLAVNMWVWLPVAQRVNTDCELNTSATSVLAVYWIYHLFVVQYGSFAQFLDIKTVRVVDITRSRLLTPLTTSASFSSSGSTSPTVSAQL